MAESTSAQSRPVFGCLLFGGPLSGALIRDVRLANELSARGFEVHVWWAMDWRWRLELFGASPGVKRAAAVSLLLSAKETRRVPGGNTLGAADWGQVPPGQG